jgi:branched-chain amino acid transport system permease protein
VEYILHVGILVGIYSVLAISLDLIAGHTGLVSLAPAAFFGIGAYSSAILTVRLGLPTPIAAILGAVAAAVISLFISLPSFRVRDDYFVICTFGFQLISFNVFNNLISVTGGPLGIVNIPSPRVFGIPINSQVTYLALVCLVLAVIYLTFRRLIDSPYGRVLHAIREDEVLAECYGKNTMYFKLTAVAVSGVFASLAGSLFAEYVTYIDPSSFTVDESILVLSMVIIGGAGSIWGAPIGAAFLILLPEMLRFAGFPTAIAANLREIAYGSALIGFMMVRPRGVVGKFDFGAD